MRVARSDDGVSFGAPVIEDTPKDFDSGSKLFGRIVRGLSKGDIPRAVVGGIAGVFDKDHMRLVGSPNLTGWVDYPFVEKMRAECGTETFVVKNDALLVGLGEIFYGAGEKKGIIAYLTVSTGVGGARFVNGVADKSSFGFEPGRQVIDPDNSLCPDCPGNTLEDYISGTSMQVRFGKKAYEIENPVTWSELAQFFAYGLYNIISHWSPDVIVVGGSMIVGSPAISIDETKKYLEKIPRIFPTLPDIRKATLGDLGGLHGAIAYIKQKNI